MEKLAGDLFLGSELVKKAILPSQFIQFLYKKLGELRHHQEIPDPLQLGLSPHRADPDQAGCRKLPSGLIYQNIGCPHHGKPTIWKNIKSCHSEVPAQDFYTFYSPTFHKFTLPLPGI